MILILVIGLGLTYIFYLILNPKSADKYGFNLGPVTTAPVSLTLAVSSPDDNLLTNSPNLLISGTTSPNSLVVISTNDNDQILTASGSGDFSYTAKLNDGANSIKISTFDDQGNSKNEDRTVYYSAEKI
ncbi:hypothetical protein HY389_01775 [Candidatus Daviesbacteria bacterium]|nr:hypothetical protein [Candidatus Daviesbacteria bacterium]